MLQMMLYLLIYGQLFAVLYFRNQMAFDRVVPPVLDLGWKYIISDVLDVASKNNVAVLPK